jgi:hypothetical protein
MLLCLQCRLFSVSESGTTKNAQQSVHPTCGSLRGLEAFFWLRAFSTSQTLSTLAHTRVTQTVDTPLAQQGKKTLYILGDEKLCKQFNGSFRGGLTCSKNKVLLAKLLLVV